MTVVQIMYEHLQLNLKIVWIIFFEAAVRIQVKLFVMFKLILIIMRTLDFKDTHGHCGMCMKRCCQMMHQGVDMFVLLKSHSVIRLDFFDETFECLCNILGLMALYLYQTVCICFS